MNVLSASGRMKVDEIYLMEQFKVCVVSGFAGSPHRKDSVLIIYA